MSGRIKVARVGEGPLYTLSSSYFSPKLVEHAKAVPGLKYDAPTRGWQGYVDAVLAVISRLKTVGIRVDGADELPSSDSWRTARTPFLFATNGLRDYQVEGVRFLIAKAREGALLADGMRLGKSCQALTAARAFKTKTLIVCPSHVVGVWGRPPDDAHGPGEIAKWWPDAWRGFGPPGDLTERGELSDGSRWADGPRPGVVCLETVKPFKASQALAHLASKTSPLTVEELAIQKRNQDELEGFVKSLESAQVIVCHYDIIYAWVHVLLRWGMQTFIIDEAHIASGYQSRRSDALKALSQAARYKMLLTGTPLTNLPKHAHNVLEILAFNRFGYFFTGARPGCYAKVWCNSFQKTVGVGQDVKLVWDHTGRSNLDEPDGKTALTHEETLHARLKHVMLRRLKKDVDPQLPHKTRQIVDVSIPARCAIAVSQGTLGSGGKELRRVLDLAADGKLKSVVDIVAGHLDEGEKVICGCYRRLFAERVASDVAKKVADGVMTMFVHGGLTQKERDKRIQALRKYDGPGVLACTIDTTATGIDLSFASVMVIAELTWEPHELSQLEERLYKFGVDAKSLIQYVIARGTGDELILRAVIQKLDTFERVVGKTGDQMREELSPNRQDGLSRLHAALVEMQKAPVTKTIRRPRQVRP
jgi:hypothetical protein